MDQYKIANMTFAAIPGHESIKTRLCYVAQHNQVPHAQLFWGAPGSAQLALALAFATYLHCSNRLANDACQYCAACLKMKKLVHPDLKFVFPISPTAKLPGKEAVSHNYLHAWRTFMQEQPYSLLSQWSYHIGSEQKQLAISREEAKHITQYLSMKPLEGHYKIVLMWLPEYLHPNAANALLKILEEPSPKTVFLLVSMEPTKIIDTIRSRAQQIHVPLFSDQAILKLLTDQYGSLTEPMQEIIPLANGNINQARELIEQHSQKSILDEFSNWMRLCYSHNLSQLVIHADTFQQLDKEAQKNFLAYALHLFRETLIIGLGHNHLSKATTEEQRFLARFQKTLKYEQIKYFIAWINQASFYLERNVNTKILWLNLSLKIAQTFQDIITKIPAK